MYLKTFEQFIAQNPLVEYRNLARTGVKINGAPYQTYDEAIGWISDSNSEIFGTTITKLLAKQGDCPDLKTILSPMFKYTENLLSNSLAAAVKTEAIPDKFSGTNYAENKLIKDLLSEAGKINSLVDSNKIYWNFLLKVKQKQNW